jgi:hypothetical protein
VRDEIKRKNEDMRLTVEKMFGEVSTVKTDRNLPAGLFMEVAKCLSQDAAPKHLATKGAGAESRLVGYIRKSIGEAIDATFESLKYSLPWRGLRQFRISCATRLPVPDNRDFIRSRRRFSPMVGC